ncbi:hypothetical protein HN358_02180 [Candidatus Uhrbacteria bacterium]|nr:hypothetical protein [Candidatus Uhrbacteria bacterium]MBT7716912.1 hypothetical protein [Candidatus Uhrbacteria bacterium]
MEKMKMTALQLCQWIKSHRSSIVFFAFIFVVAITLPNVAFADFDELLIGATGSINQIILALLAYLLSLVLAGIGKLIVMILGALIIPILGYNNFGNSAIVNLGWPLVRDVVNMFVIVVLLVIAVQTILGYQKAQWEAQLPRFFIAVVLVNFSRTICLIMIDVSQVVMFTFVNALRDIAAGNFMNLFQLTDFTVINSETLTELAGIGNLELAKMYVELSLILSLLLVVLAVIGILAIVYLYRIIVLWVLIILSPIAFFLGGITQLFGEAGGRYKEWWNMFTAALTLGPMLTFFLWLGLAAASSDPIAVSEGMNFAGTEDIPTLFAEIFMSEKIVSLAIGLILIMVGFKVSSKAAQQLGNVASKLITEDAGKKMVKNMVKAPASLAYRGAKWAGKEGGKQLMGRTDIGKQLGAGLTDMGKEMAAKGGFIGGIAGRGLIGAGGQVRRGAEGPNIEGRKKAQENIAGMDMDERIARAGAIVNADGTMGGTPPSLSGQREQEAIMLNAVTDGGFRKKLKKDMTEDQYSEFMKASMQHVDKNSDELLTEDADKKSFKKTKAGNMREWIDGKAEREGEDFDAQKEINDIVSDEDFKVGHLSADDVADPEIRAALEAKTVRSWTAPDGTQHTENMMQQLQSGRGVKEDVKQAALTGFTGEVDLAEASADQIAEAVRSGIMDIGGITADSVADPVRAQEIAVGLARGGVNLANIEDDAVRASLGAALQGEAERDDISNQDRARINQARVQAGVDVNQVFNIQNNADVEGQMAGDITRALSDDPTIIQNFDAQLVEAENSGATDVTRAITEAMSNVDFKGMATQFNQAQSQAERDQISAMLDRHETALRAEAGRDDNDAGRDRELLRHQRQINLARRDM